MLSVIVPKCRYAECRGALIKKSVILKHNEMHYLVFGGKSCNGSNNIMQTGFANIFSLNKDIYLIKNY
jgi:hypothetical protein